jgi:Ni/Co efflux regulator RcnB
MKSFLAILLALSLIFAPSGLFAKAGGKGKGKRANPSESAYEHASDNARFKRGDDLQGSQNQLLGTYDHESDVDNNSRKGKDKGDADASTDDVKKNKSQEENTLENDEKERKGKSLKKGGGSKGKGN